MHLLPADGWTTVERFVEQTYDELGDFVDEPFELTSLADDRAEFRRLGAVRSGDSVRPLSMEKSYSFEGDRMNPSVTLEVAVENKADSAVEFELAVEWNVNLLGGGHNPAAFYETADGARSPHDEGGEDPGSTPGSPDRSTG